MAIASTLQQYLEDQDIAYEVITHQPTKTSSRAAQASHISGTCLAKGVVLSREGGFTLAVVPATCNVQMDAVADFIEGPVSIASEDEIGELFPDCNKGAIPPLGEAYGLDVIVDESLERRSDIYFEAGDHESLIHLTGSQFHNLHEDIPHGPIAKHW